MERDPSTKTHDVLDLDSLPPGVNSVKRFRAARKWELTTSGELVAPSDRLESRFVQIRPLNFVDIVGEP